MIAIESASEAEPIVPSSATFRVDRVPTEVMFVCAAVVSVPSTFAATIVPFAIVKLPVSEPVAVVVPNTNLSALSSQPINALSPVEPRSMMKPMSFALEVAPVFNSIRVSSITVLDAEFVTVAPLTVRFPVTIKFCEAVTLPEASITSESASPTEPI